MKIKEWLKLSYAGWIFLLFSCAINLTLVLVISDTRTELTQCQQELSRKETTFVPLYHLPEPCEPCMQVEVDTFRVEAELRNAQWELRKIKNAIENK